MPRVRETLIFFDRRLEALSHGGLTLLCLVLLTLCALADHLTGREISLSIAYLAPTSLAAWYGGRWYGVVLAIVSAALWLAVDLSAGNHYSHRLIPFWNTLVRLGFFLIVGTLLLHIRSLLDQLAARATTDSLTGLANSRAFFERLDEELERSRRYQHPLTVAYIDLDNFKKVNDTWGHATGDQVLKEVAAGLKGAARATDLVARLGGDEFALLLPESSPTQVESALQKFHARLIARMAEYGWPVGCSLGAVTAPPSSTLSREELVKKADNLMYQVKQSGKNGLRHQVLPD